MLAIFSSFSQGASHAFSWRNIHISIQWDMPCFINITLVVLLIYPFHDQKHFFSEYSLFKLLNVLKTSCSSYLWLHILETHNGFFIFHCGVLISALFEELVPLTVEHRYHFHPLRIAQSPGLSVILTGLLYLNPLLIVIASFSHIINFHLITWVSWRKRINRFENNPLALPSGHFVYCSCELKHCRQWSGTYLLQAISWIIYLSQNHIADTQIQSYERLKLVHIWQLC